MPVRAPLIWFNPVVARAHDRRLDDRRHHGNGSTAVLQRHPLLSLQQTAGNGAVTQVLQRAPASPAVQRRNPDRYISSGVALAVIDKVYKGKCDADFGSVRMKYSWSVGMLANDASITFVCGPQSFRFSTSIPWGGSRFPWGIGLVTGGTAWVTDTIEKALDTIYDHWEDERGGFWDAVKTVKDSLKLDIDRYCDTD